MYLCIQIDFTITKVASFKESKLCGSTLIGKTPDIAWFQSFVPNII